LGDPDAPANPVWSAAAADNIAVLSRNLLRFISLISVPFLMGKRNLLLSDGTGLFLPPRIEQT